MLHAMKSCMRVYFLFSFDFFDSGLELYYEVRGMWRLSCMIGNVHMLMFRVYSTYHSCILKHSYLYTSIVLVRIHSNNVHGFRIKSINSNHGSDSNSGNDL